MLFHPRIARLARTPDKSQSEPSSPYLQLLTSQSDEYAAQKHAKNMLLVHQTSSVKVGEIIRYVCIFSPKVLILTQNRYTLTYEPAADRVVPSPSHLHLRIKNTSAIPLRAAYLHGPFAIHVATYPSTFNPNSKVQNPRQEGIPQFEPNLKAGSAFWARLTVPEDLRIRSQAHANEVANSNEKRTVTWIIEVTSQILFSSTASVKFDVSVGRDEKSLNFNRSEERR